jgi:hypothetical protein
MEHSNRAAPEWMICAGRLQGGQSDDGVTGFSILEAGSADEVETILDGHPHLATPGNSIEVPEFIQMG